MSSKNSFCNSRLVRAFTLVSLCFGIALQESQPIYGFSPSPPLTRKNMVLIKGTNFRMGTDEGAKHEGPQHDVTLNDFWIDKYEVTIAEFADFVKASGYTTDAERRGKSLVYDPKTDQFAFVKGADWKHPTGLAKLAKPNEPVTQVSWEDAIAYAKWSGKRLPTEAEWEFAARGGLEGKLYPWGDTNPQQDRHLANILGAEDGYAGVAPVGRYKPNGYGLYDMAGNVWEWCQDGFETNYYASSPRENPKGPAVPEVYVMRGGSWLCGGNHCLSYRVAARGYGGKDGAMNHRGFRCVSAIF